MSITESTNIEQSYCLSQNPLWSRNPTNKQVESIAPPDLLIIHQASFRLTRRLSLHLLKNTSLFESLGASSCFVITTHTCFPELLKGSNYANIELESNHMCL